MTDSMGTLRKRLSADDQALFDQLTKARGELSRAVLRGPSGQTPAERQRAAFRIEEEVRRLEAAISSKSADFRARTKPISVETVKAALPEGAVLIELFVYQPFNARAPFNQRYG